MANAVKIRQLPDGQPFAATHREQSGSYYELDLGADAPALPSESLVEIRSPETVLLGMVVANSGGRMTVHVEHVLNLSQLVIHPDWAAHSIH